MARLDRLRALLPLLDLEVERAMQQLEMAMDRRCETREQIALVEAVTPGGRYSAEAARALAVRVDLYGSARRPVGRPPRDTGPRALLKVEMDGGQSCSPTRPSVAQPTWSSPVVGPEKVPVEL
jgi:hypothetical protein